MFMKIYNILTLVKYVYRSEYHIYNLLVVNIEYTLTYEWCSCKTKYSQNPFTKQL